MEKKLNIKPIIFMLLLPVVCAVGLTLAYYTSEVRVVNKFKTNTYNVDIEDRSTGSWGERTVSFINREEENSSVVLRINYNESWTNKNDDVLLTIDNTVNGVNAVSKEWTDEFKNNFIKGEDGWYYYTKVLNAKESVKVLNSVDLNQTLIETSPYYNEYLTYTYDLSFNFEAIQATSKAVEEIWNKKITIEGNEVTWEL